MMVSSEKVLSQLDQVLARYHAAGPSAHDRMPIGRLKELVASAHAIIERSAPPGSPYILSCHEALEAGFIGDDAQLEWLMGIVQSLRHDYAAGALAPIEALIRAEVFADFMDMAEHLLELGYKDPAAVIVGGVLEQHLRKLCLAAGVPTLVNNKPKKADTINAELASKNVYGKLDLKNVTSWLDLRNKAAHAEYAAYGDEQVRLLLLGVRDFTRRASP